MKILLVPLDDRPVTYTYPQLVARCAGLETMAPPRSLMGSLSRGAQIEELFSFVENSLRHEPDALVIALDSLLYGGLITSRRTTETLKTIQGRLDRLKKWKEMCGKGIPIYCQSSIMRISDNYDNTEEKEYWSRFGRELFEWSSCMHRLSAGEKLTAGLLQALERRIPADIRQDYLATRFRNFSINQAALKAVEEGCLDHVTFSQDDSGTWGLNVGEKNRLIAMSEQLNLQDKVSVYAGADEVTVALISKLIADRCLKKKPSIEVHFSPDGAATSAIASRYEGQDIGTTTITQLQASGAAFTITAGLPKEIADITMIVHGPQEKQGDHITLPGLPDLSQMDTNRSVERTLALIKESTKPVLLCDVAYANGGDPALMEELIQNPELLAKLCAYAGWNTTGNTIGSALGTAIANFAHSGRSTDAGNEYHKRCLFTRLADDWAYQTKVRKQLDSDPSTQKLAELISPYIKRISSALGFEPSVRLSFPWRRTFEIEIGFEGN